MRLYAAICELIEARTELLREEAATLHLGKFAEGYKAGREDLLDSPELAYIGACDDDDEDEDDD